MEEDRIIANFNQDLDEALRIASPSDTPRTPVDEETAEMLLIAQQISEINFPGIKPPQNEMLRDKPPQAIGRFCLDHFFRPKTIPGLLVGIAALFLVLSFIFFKPDLASAFALLGYSYVDDIGFLKTDSFLLLNPASVNTTVDSSIEISRGLAQPEKTTLWIKFNRIDGMITPEALEKSWLEVADGTRLYVKWWQYQSEINTPSTLVLEYPAIPKKMTQTTLVIPAPQIMIHLAWMSGQAYPTRGVTGIVPASVTVDHPAEQLARTGSGQSCREIHDLSVCIETVGFTKAGVALMLDLKRNSGNLYPGDIRSKFFDLSTEQSGIYLEDVRGTRYPSTGIIQTDVENPDHARLTIQFIAPQSSKMDYSLIIPVIYTHTDVNQSLRVNLGEDPAPSTNQEINQTILIDGIPVHFQNASFTGNGTDQLRLEMISDPIEEKNGLVVGAFQMEIPKDRIGYISDKVLDRVALEFELISPISGKKTGDFELYVQSATVILAGPIEIPLNREQGK